MSTRRLDSPWAGGGRRSERAGKFSTWRNLSRLWPAEKYPSAKEMIWVLLGQALVLSGGIVGVKVLTNLLGPEGYGQLALFMTVPGVMSMFVYGPLGKPILRFHSVFRERGQIPLLIHIVKKIHSAVALILFLLLLVALLVTHFWISPKWTLFLLVAVVTGVASGWNVSMVSGFLAVRRQGVVAMHSGTEAWLRMILAIALIWLFRGGGFSALMGYFLAAVAVAASLGSIAMRTPALRMSAGQDPPAGEEVKKGMREFAEYASPFAIWAGFGAVGAFADRWVLQGLMGEGAVGIYEAIFHIANAPFAISIGILSRLMLPIIYQRAGALENESRIRECVGLVNWLAVFVVVFLFAVLYIFYNWGEPLVLLFTAREFAEHHQLLWLIGAGISVFQVGQILTWKGFSLNRPQIYILPKGLQAGSFLLLAYLIGGRLGIEGIALALCGSSVVYLAAVLMANRRLVRSFEPKSA